MGEHSFSKRLSLNVVLLTSVLFIITIAVASVASHLLIAQEAEKSSEHLRDAAILKIENRMQSVEISVMSVAGFLANTPDDPRVGYLLTNRLVSSNSNVVGSAVAYRDGYFKGKHFHSPYSWIDSTTGEIKNKQLGNDDYDYFSMEWYSVPATTGEPHWSEPYVDEGGGEYLMTTYSYPVKDAAGNVYAVVTADITIETMSDFLSTIKPYPSSYVSMVSSGGKYLNLDMDPDSLTVMQELSRKIESDGTGRIIYKVGHNTSFAVFGPLSNGWQLFITCDYREVLERTSIMHLVLILLGLVGLSVLFAICYSTIKRMTKPIADFSDSAIRIAGGDFQIQLPPYKYDDELGRLRESFDFMQHSLTNYIENLRSTTAAKHSMESELKIASAIQMAMLPKAFSVSDKVDIHAFLKPAKEVGGDFYDFFVKDNLLFFTVGDVSGKGVPASMFMAITRSAFRFISQLGLPLDKVVTEINNAICDGNTSGMFVTMFVGCIDLTNGHMTYCNAGHNPIMVNGSYLKAKPNLAAGLFPDFPYQLERLTLGPGSSLLLYTDGVTEAERADKMQYGEDRLAERAANLSEASSEEVCSSITEDITAFTEGNDQNDDITIMNIKLL